ncbi:MAG: hypothetical protein KBI18_02395 [Brachymonas sp.]|nr:hypothetical protein [Brachymonas sp.]
MFTVGCCAVCVQQTNPNGGVCALFAPASHQNIVIFFRIFTMKSKVLFATLSLFAASTVMAAGAASAPAAAPASAASTAKKAVKAAKVAPAKKAASAMKKAASAA